ncbi:MAG TPA: efflux RND transporter periplasmic adaptor subunit, partial [Gemmatimonadaceae bacterium]|nr:efflux RND transporter periplasmic adaptor subunit [Gemmatimonadaceae bacterium]
RAALAALLLFIIACGDDSAARGATPAAAGEAKGAANGGGPAGGRRAPSVTLASTDVMTVSRTELEEGTAITGDLLPIETVEVRARLEGDLVGVYVREGQRVTEGQVLARFEASEQESDQQSAEAARAAAETELSTAQWNLEQAEELFRAGAIPERDLKATQQGVAAARASLAAAEARVRSTSSFVRDTRVLAPTSGVVQRRMVQDGEHVARGAPMFTVVRNDVLELAAAVPANSAEGVTPGKVVRFSAGGRQIDGRVARVSPTVDPATRSITIYVQIPNPGGVLKGGTFASGRIVGRTIPSALAIPTSSLRQLPDGRPFVFKIDGTVLAQAPVRLGVVDQERAMAEVLEGLAEGDRIITGNVGTLGAGMSVTVVGSEKGR